MFVQPISSKIFEHSHLHLIQSNIPSHDEILHERFFGLLESQFDLIGSNIRGQSPCRKLREAKVILLIQDDGSVCSTKIFENISFADCQIYCCLKKDLMTVEERSTKYALAAQMKNLICSSLPLMKELEKYESQPKMIVSKTELIAAIRKSHQSFTRTDYHLRKMDQVEINSRIARLYASATDTIKIKASLDSSVQEMLEKKIEIPYVVLAPRVLEVKTSKKAEDTGASKSLAAYRERSQKKMSDWLISKKIGGADFRMIYLSMKEYFCLWDVNFRS